MRLKRVISAALAVSMAVSMMPATAVSAFATDVGNSVAVQTAGNELTYNCGATENDHVTVSLVKNSDNETYTLVVSGTGSMADYSKVADVPWYGDNGQLMKKVTKGIVKSGITHLGARTFVLAENLTSVELPEGLLSIGVSCFNQTGLKSIQFPSTLQKIDDNAFWRGQIAGDVHIPESVTAIGKNVFNKCPITSVNLPEGLQVLGGGAFSETKLTEMPEIPESITVLDSTFQGCTDIKEVTIPSQVTDISGAFAGTGISTVTIPYQVTNYYRAFNGCGSLEKVVIESQSDTIPSGGSAQGVFQNCIKLKSVTLPEWVTTIGNYAFSGCTSLKDTAFLKDVKSIGDFAFQNAGLSGNLVLNATSIGYKAFINCVNLGPNVCFANVATIGANGNTTIFNDCTGLTGVKYIQQEQKTPNMSTLQTTAILNGGTLTNDTVYPDGELATPVKEGYTFAGWYDNAGLTGEAVTNPVTGKTYYAKWAKNNYTVTFNNNGHDKKPADKSVEYGDSVPSLPELHDSTNEWVFDGWYMDANFATKYDSQAITGNTTLYAKWHEYQNTSLTAKVSKSNYLVNTPADVNVTVTPGDDIKDLKQNVNNIKISLTYDDDVTSVMLNGKELTEKEYTISELMQLMGQNRELKLNVTYGKAGTHTFGIVLKNGDKIVSECGTDIVVAEKAAELTPATELYTLTVKNADVTIKNGDEEIKAEKNDKGELIAKVPEKADVTVTYTSQSDAVAFDQWTITTDETLDVDVKNNPLKFQMPAGGVTIEAMTKDASIEEDEPNILGTAAVVGTAAAGTAILAWQGYQLGTELYLKTALPAGTAIPTNRAELALLVWNHAGKPAPAAVLPADATDTQKAIAWAVENDLLKAAKDNGETYVDTDSVSRVEVIRVWNKAQEK
jgi:uncharacterized repeat protein (TIGR02543 family)